MLGENNGDTPCPRRSDPFCHPTIAPGTLPSTGCKGMGQGGSTPGGLCPLALPRLFQRGAGALLGSQGAGLGAGWSRVRVLGLDLGRVLGWAWVWAGCKVQGWVRVWAGCGVQVLNSGRVQVLGPDLGRGQFWSWIRAGCRAGFKLSGPSTVSSCSPGASTALVKF